MNQLQLFLPCAAGVEGYLADEVTRILCEDQPSSPAPVLEAGRGGVMVSASWRDAMLLNLRSRLAQRVLIQLSNTPYRGEDDIYEATSAIAWEVWFTVKNTFKVEITAQHSPLRSLNFAALRVKDAICDRFRLKAQGERPSVDTHWPHARVYVHLTSERMSLYIDTSGEPLFKRGWREDKGDAPLKETLAAAMLAASGWDAAARLAGAAPLALYDPCCGSGTIAIEAAQIAAHVPAGSGRRFGFENLLAFAPHVWGSIVAKAQDEHQAWASSHQGQEIAIFGSDVAHRMVDFSQRNAQRAGVAHLIEFKGGDALQRKAPTERAGVMLVNPPYGERIDAAGLAGQKSGHRAPMRDSRGAAASNHRGMPAQRGVPNGRGTDRLIWDDDFQGERDFDTAPAREPSHAQSEQRSLDADFFSKLASHWKKNFPGWTAWVLTPDMKLPTAMRLKETRRVPMWNGPIECRLFRFDMVAGRMPERMPEHMEVAPAKPASGI